MTASVATKVAAEVTTQITTPATFLTINVAFYALMIPSFSAFLRSTSLTLLLVIAGYLPAAHAQLPPGFSTGPKMGGIEEVQLANGLKVLLLEDRSQPLVTTNITYLVGSRHEGYGEAGMAHLLEHLVFKGTPKRKDIKAEFTARGARWNGTTYYDRTNYFLTFSSAPANLEWAIELEADRMVNSFISRSDLDSEMTVVRNEFESGENNVGNVLAQKVARAAYQWHNYGRPTIGNRSDIENVPIDRLQAFYRTYYQPDNAVLLIAGDFERKAVLDLVARHFGAIPKPARLLPRTYTDEAAQDGEREVRLSRTGENRIVMAFYHAPAGTHADYAAIDVLALVLGDTPTGRLHKALVETKIATGVGGSDLMLAERGGMRFVASAPKTNPVGPMRDALVKTVEGLAADPIRADEVERARQRLLTQMDVSLTKTHSFATGLTEWIALGDWRWFFRYRDYLHNVTAADVNRAAATYLIASNRTLGQFDPVETAPQRASLPARPDLAAALKDYAGPLGISETAGAGERFDPTPANIEARTTRFTLPDGLKVAFLPKKTRGGMVSATLAFQYGTEESKFGRGQACSFAGAMLMRGTRSRTRDELRNEMTRLRTNLSVGGGGASVEVPAAGLEESLKLVSEILREPRFDEAEFEQLRRQSIAGIESARTEPSALSGLALARHLNPYPRGHWNYAASLEEQLEEVRAVKLADAKKCHENFFGLSHGQMAISGEFDPEKIRPMITDVFGTMQRKAPFIRIPERTRKDAPPLATEIATPDKANATLRASIVLDASDDDPDYAALVIANYLFGGSIDARLAKRIREKDGLSYSVGSGLSVSTLDRYGQWSASAIYAPQNKARVEAALREELDRARRDGFTLDELTKAKDAILQSRALGRASDMGLASRLSSHLYFGRTFDWDAQFEAALRAVTLAAVNAAFVKHIDPTRMHLVKAGDFTKQ